MRTRTWLAGIVCLLVPLGVACNDSDRSAPADDGSALESPVASDRDDDGRVLAGQLRSVDPEKQTLMVAFEDELYEFAYSDETEVVGRASNVQGLTGKAGDRVTVRYRENPITSTKTATRIELQ